MIYSFNKKYKYPTQQKGHTTHHIHHVNEQVLSHTE